VQALAAASLGLSAAFVTVSVGGVAFALLGRSTMPVAGPRSATALIVAGLLAELARDPATVGGAHGLGLAMSAIGCTVALAGRAQIALGASRLGRFAQFVPQPVLTGFMNGVALLIVVSQRPALLGTHDGSLASLLDPAGWHPRTLAIGLATAGCTWLLAWRWPRSPHQLLGLGFGIALYALAVALNPDDPPGAQIGPEQPGRHWPDLPRRLGEADTAAFMLRHASAIVATAAVLALIGTPESVLNALAIDQQLGTDHDASRELLTLGATNLVVGLFCGRQAVMLRTRAQATLNAGGAGRRAALAGAVAFALMALLLGPALALLPKVVLAGSC
jgi:SulP family sulfate permease